MDEESLTVTVTADDPSVTTITAQSAMIDIRENDNDGKFKYSTTTLYFAIVLLLWTLLRQYTCHC